MFAPCISSIKKHTFIVPTDAHYYKIIGMLKQNFIILCISWNNKNVFFRYRLYTFNSFDDRNTIGDDRQYFILVSWPISGFLKIVHKIILMGSRYSFPNSYFL